MVHIFIHVYMKEKALKHVTRMQSIVFVFSMMAFPAFSGGGGGLIYGGHIYIQPYANYNLVASYFGGLGYGTIGGGQKIGGFGVALLSNSMTDEFAGGFGGLLTGQEFTSGPFLFSINLMTGFGGISANFGEKRAFFSSVCSFILFCPI